MSLLERVVRGSVRKILAPTKHVPCCARESNSPVLTSHVVLGGRRSPERVFDKEVLVVTLSKYMINTQKSMGKYSHFALGVLLLGTNTVFSSVATSGQIPGPSKTPAGIAIQRAARASWLNALPTDWRASGNICLVGFQREITSPVAVKVPWPRRTLPFTESTVVTTGAHACSDRSCGVRGEEQAFPDEPFVPRIGMGHEGHALLAGSICPLYLSLHLLNYLSLLAKGV